MSSDPTPPPAPGTGTDWWDPGPFEVAPGVHRIPLPLPGDGLRAVNVYAIEQPDGLVLVDAGWALGQAREDLAAALGHLDHDLGDVRRVLVTHVHRDHYELALHLRRAFGCHVALGIGEQPSLRQLQVEQDRPEDSPMLARLLAAGAQPLVAALDAARARRGDHDRIAWEFPDAWLHDATTVELDGRTLEVHATPGHTQGHVVFADRAAGVLFSGDHVLPHITPSIGFESVPARSPLGDYLASLAVVRALPDLRMLPAHGPVQATTHGRIAELVAHHDDRLERSLDVVVHGAATAFEVAAGLPWTRHERRYDELDVFNQLLAVNETVAHLDVLVDRGALAVEVVDGVHHHRA